jgi:UDP-N-acetylglucosamine 2-epimerase
MVTVLINCGSISFVNVSLIGNPEMSSSSSMQKEASHMGVACPALTAERRPAFLLNFPVFYRTAKEKIFGL